MLYLEQHPPRRRQYYLTRREPPSGAIVLHTAESFADIVLPDQGAEGVAGFISTRLEPGSYHTIVDSDSIVRVGNFNWTMFGEGTGGNKFALHLSWACEADQWGPLIAQGWADKALNRGVAAAVQMAEWLKTAHGIVVPAKHITKAEYFDRQPGFIAHGELDPKRRHDPGGRFPWEIFLSRFSAGTGIQVERQEHPVSDALILPSNRKRTIERIQQAAKAAGFYGGMIDGDPFEGTAEAVEALAAELKSFEVAAVLRDLLQQRSDLEAEILDYEDQLRGS